MFKNNGRLKLGMFIISIVTALLSFSWDLLDLDRAKANISDMIVNALEETETSNEYKIDELDKFDSTATKIMIVAHPDDETLWGGNALYHDKYLVVCITCGVVEARVEEFKKAMEVTKDDYIMLGYPDLVKGKKSDWADVKDDIYEDIKNILDLKNWDTIVTHNPDGEYGHIHHKMTNKIVTTLSNHRKLYYFGIYYSDDIPEDIYRLTEDEFNFKTTQVLPVYVTQYNTIRNLSKMIHHENWISYSEWYS